jgi:hypothetical protein
MIAPEKVCPADKQNEIDVSRVLIKDGNILKMNLLDARAVFFMKAKPVKFERFFNEITTGNIFAILCQLNYLLVWHKTVFRSN